MSHGGSFEVLPSDENEEHTGKGVVRIASVAALGGFLFGYDSAVINGAVGAIGDHFHADPASLGFAVASALIGAAVGALTAGGFADRFGRLFVMKIAAVLFLISAIGTALAPNLVMLVVFRIVGGAGVGVASVIAPTYISEVSPARIRGRLASLQQLAIVTGIFISLLVDYIFQSAAGGASKDFALGLEAWRWMFLAMSIPALAYGLLSLTIPESPRFLVAVHRIPEARKILSALLGEKGVDIKIDTIQRTLAVDKKPSWVDLRAPGTGLAPIVWVGLGLSIFQQFVGINVIFYYSTILWQAVGFSESDSFKITVISAVVNIVTTFIAIGTIDKFGRKPLLLIGSSGMFVTLGVMSYIFGTAPVVDGIPQLSDVEGIVALLAANLFVVAFGMSWGPVVWVLLGESFPNRIRAAALSFAAAGQWVANWAITVSFPSLKDFSLGFAYGFYSLCALLSGIFVWKWVEETKGKELEDMHT
ncbi:sugar porter family MFS transporter [Smaragdicoccus niigatensis]|uniref:sugar porter family MFS transporter n=1 Tax=Smaragdicoccus niigatensis TaxID=359359 RepID=UPI00035F50E1|nr:sugar porter family MFS transporter [Smaragdicoccus niigatensis]